MPKKAGIVSLCIVQFRCINNTEAPLAIQPKQHGKLADRNRKKKIETR